MWQNMDSVVAPYHWDDRKKLFKDYNFIQKAYEKQLKDLSFQLNQIHNVNHSLRYWRILIGPWLGLFMEILFDRWFMLKQVLEQNEVDTCKILDSNKESLIPNDMSHFVQLFNYDDWNEKICGQLLDMFWGNDLHVEKVPAEINFDQKALVVSKSWTMSPKVLAKKILSRFYPLTVKDNEYFFISSYLPLKVNCRLQIQLGQFPKIWQFIAPANVKPDLQKRLGSLMAIESKDAFSDVLSKMIPLHIPTAYLEGYEMLTRKTKELPWPKEPRAIFTSNAYSADDVFKSWAAGKTEKGTPLIIGQHGGHFGMSPWSSYEDHQVAIADTWLSWGWSVESKPQVKPVGNLKEFRKNVSYNSNGKGLMVGMALPRYSYTMYALPVAGQWLSYFEDQCRFMTTLPDPLREEIIVRLFKQDYGWDQRARWRDRFPKVITDSGDQPIRNLIERSRIVIATYNSTTYLESLASNVPTIIFWNPKHWELREEVKPYFEQLKSVGVFHETPESAANQVTTVWDDIASWWESDEVQGARSNFCKQFSHVPEKPIDELVALFKEIA